VSWPGVQARCAETACHRCSGAINLLAVPVAAMPYPTSLCHSASPFRSGSQ